MGKFPGGPAIIIFKIGLCDVKKNLERFVDQFLMMFSTPMLAKQIAEKFLKKETDLNALYGLAKDRITSISENIQQAGKSVSKMDLWTTSGACCRDSTKQTRSYKQKISNFPTATSKILF